MKANSKCVLAFIWIHIPGYQAVYVCVCVSFELINQKIQIQIHMQLEIANQEIDSQWQFR